MKKGFTLVELLVVIVIIGALATLILPNVLKTYTKSLAKAMQIQENEIKDAARLMVTDYCNQPTKERVKKNKNPGTDELTCKTTKSDGTYTGIIQTLDGNIESNDPNKVYFVCIDSIKHEGYYENELEYEGDACVAFVTFKKDDTGRFEGQKGYIFCGDSNDTNYITDDNYEMLDYYAKCGSGAGTNQGKTGEAEGE